MNYLIDKILRGTHRLYVDHYGQYLKPLDRISDPDEASDIIYQQLESDAPCMIARYGSVEILCVNNYLGIKKYEHNIWKYITDKSPQFWWNNVGIQNMQNNAGFFPLTEQNLERFGELMIEDSKQVDILGSWRLEERRLVDANTVKAVQLLLLEPFHTKTPWTRALKEKKVLVVHPFAKTIQQQYKQRRTLLFKNPDILPKFQLGTFQAVQSIGGQSFFNTWFDALQYMKDEIDKQDYDIALIGCGVYGFPLAAHIKRSGKKAIHLGGALQLLFGIKGKRWTNPTYGMKSLPFITENYYNNLMNEFWTSPAKTEKPLNANNVEGACYW